MAAEAVGATMLRVATPNWMPSGASGRGTRETISIISEHVASHDRTILVLDELDKIVAGPGGSGDGGTPWQSYIRAEAYDLLDSRWPAGLCLPSTDDDDPDPDPDIDSLTRKLRDTVFIVGIGTFQGWFDDDKGRRSVGFGPEMSPENDELSAEIVAEKMPRELANRFNGGLIRLPELRASDYHRIAEEVENQLPERMRETFRGEVARLLPEAIAAKKGVRFLEECMLGMLLQLPPEPEKIAAEIVKPTPEIKTLDHLCTL